MAYNDQDERDFDSKHGMSGGHFGSDPDSPDQDTESYGNGDGDSSYILDTMNQTFREPTLLEKISSLLGASPETTLGISNFGDAAKVGLSMIPGVAPALGLYSLADAAYQKNWSPIANTALGMAGVNPLTRSMVSLGVGGLTNNTSAMKMGASGLINQSLTESISDPRTAALARVIAGTGLNKLGSLGRTGANKVSTGISDDLDKGRNRLPTQKGKYTNV